MNLVEEGWHQGKVYVCACISYRPPLQCTPLTAPPGGGGGGQALDFVKMLGHGLWVKLRSTLLSLTSLDVADRYFRQDSGTSLGQDTPCLSHVIEDLTQDPKDDARACEARHKER